jgi:hypothetical protein
MAQEAVVNWGGCLRGHYGLGWAEEKRRSRGARLGAISARLNLLQCNADGNNALLEPIIYLSHSFSKQKEAMRIMRKIRRLWFKEPIQSQNTRP